MSKLEDDLSPWTTAIPRTEPRRLTKTEKCRRPSGLEVTTPTLNAGFHVRASRTHPRWRTRQGDLLVEDRTIRDEEASTVLAVILYIKGNLQNLALPVLVCSVQHCRKIEFQVSRSLDRDPPFPHDKKWKL